MTDHIVDINKKVQSSAATAAALAIPPPEPPALCLGAEWQPCVKLPITVHVREQRPGETHRSTREGITPLRHDDLIMRGVEGEEYPIGRDLFCKTYRLGEATPPPEPVAYIHRQGNYWEPSERVLQDDEKERGWTEEPLYAATPPPEPLRPIPVSERLPEAGDCDTDGSCWVHQPNESWPESPEWKLMRNKYVSTIYRSTHWLPYNAIPIPEVTP